MLEENKGIILKKIKGFYSILDKQKKIHQCKIRAGLFQQKNQEIFAAVGDVISFQKEGWITKIEPRKNQLVRLRQGKPQVLFANLNQIFILDSLHTPNYEFVLGTAYAIQKEQIKPIVILTKSDLVTEKKWLLQRNFYKQTALQVFKFSIHQKESTMPIQKLLKNKVSAFFGQSGVGKSSMLNSLFPEMDLKVASLQKSLQGKHTTTKTELYLKNKNSLIADSPGIKEFVFYELDRLHLAKNFFQFKELPAKCHYKNCLHQAEPRCAIIEAVQNKQYPSELYQIYLSLLQKQKVGL